MWIFAISLFFLTASIDNNMTKQEQKATGVYKLTKKERRALQSWIDGQTVSQGVSTPPSVKTQTKHPLIEENLQNGHYLRLTDQTNWEIYSEDVNITQGWLAPTEIVVSASSNPEYPYVLTNVLTGSSVRARRINQIPQPKPTYSPVKGSKSQPVQPPKASSQKS